MDRRLLTDLFRTCELSKQNIKAIIDKYDEDKGLSREFWDALGQDKKFSNKTVDELHFTAELGELTGYHLPLVRELQRRRKRGTMQHAIDLLELDWKALIKKSVGGKAIGVPPGFPGKTKTERAKKYASFLFAKASELFPTEVIAHKIKQENDAANQALIRFFEANPAFDFNTASIDTYLDKEPDALKPIADDERPLLIEQLKKMERLFWLTADIPDQYEAMRKLIDDGLDSAHAIASIGQAAFCTRYPENQEEIKNPRAVYANASHRAATAMAILAKYSPQFNSVDLAVLPRNSVASNSEDTRDQNRTKGANGGQSSNDKKSGNRGSGNGGPKIPDWESIFGSLNRCQCEHCRSVLSPSAYLVDLLALLKNLQLTKSGQPRADSSDREEPTALKVLLDRRPDIAELELSCANTDTLVPYLDLVNEVLENGVFPISFSLRENLENFERELNEGKISEDLRKKFLANERPLSKKAEVTVCKEFFQWVIRDRRWKYIIESRVVRDNNKAPKAKFDVTVKPPVQTKGSPDELNVNPEHINIRVYEEALKKKIYPWNLPFDLFAEEARVYLEHLGVSRPRMMELFLTSDNEKEITIAREYFGFTQTEYNLLIDVGAMKPWEVWGEDSKGTDKQSWIDKLELNKVRVFLERSGLNYEQLTDLVKTHYVNPDDKVEIKFPSLKNAGERATTSPCDYTEATIKWPEDVSEAGKLLYKVHTFLRLQRKTGWSIGELYKVLKALGYTGKSFDNALLVELRHIHTLQNNLRVPLEELLSWFAAIDTDPGLDGGKSLYDRLFLNRSVQSSDNENFELNERRTDLEYLEDDQKNLEDDQKNLEDDQRINDANNRSVICAALQINAGDFDALLTELFPDEKKRELTMQSLSRLHRAASLAKALRLSIRDFLSLRAMTGVHPDDPTMDSVYPTKAAALFVAHAHKVKDAGFTIAELDYILCHRDRPQSSFKPSDRQIAQIMEELRTGLRAIHDEYPSKAEANDSQVAMALLRLNWDENLVAKVIEILYKDKAEIDKDYEAKNKENKKDEAEKVLLEKWLRTFETPECEVKVATLSETDKCPPALEKKVSFDAETKILRFRGWMTDPEKEELEKWTGDKGAIDTLYKSIDKFDPASEAARFLGKKMGIDEFLDKKPEDRFQILLEALLPYVRQVFSEEIVKQKLAQVLKLNEKVIDDLLTKKWVEVPGGDARDDKVPGEKAISPFVRSNFAQSHGTITSTAASFPDQFNTFCLLHKVALLIQRFRIEPGELEWLFNKSPFKSGLDVNALPMTEQDTSDGSLFAGFSGLVDLFAVRDQIGTEAVARLFELTKSNNYDQARGDLSRIAGWSVGDIIQLEKKFGPTTKWTGPTLRRFQEFFAALTRLGVPAERALAWSTPDVSNQTAQEIKQAVKAKYDDERWREVARPLRDGLREKQRAALVAYLMAKRGLKNSHELFEHYLIDVDMSPCMMTSRTKLAISSVQLFIQRLLMNLEAWRIPPDQGDFCKQQWKWLKNYRVWEANRQVFLYPENWIEPDLRKDKTEFFKDLESELLQGELTAASAEQALISYLEKLEAVARIEICGLFHEKETEEPMGRGVVTVDVLHVFGRTRGFPKGYYYRRRAEGLWTAWEKVDAAIDGDHLIPVVFNRRLYLFWPIFIEKSSEFSEKNTVETGKGKKTIIQHIKHIWDFWEVQLAYSEYRQGLWSPKKILDGNLVIDAPPEINPEINNVSEPDEQISVTKKHEREKESAFTFKTRIDYTALTILCAHQTTDGKYKGQGGFRFTNDERIEIITDADAGSDLPMPFGKVPYDGMVIRPQATSKWPLQINSTTLLGKTPTRKQSPRGVRLICSHQLPMHAWLEAFFYQDDDRTFLVTADRKSPAPSEDSRSESSFPLTYSAALAGSTPTKFRIENFYHPTVSEFIKLVNRDGLQGLLRRSEQERNRETMLFWLGSWEKKFFAEKDGGDIERIFKEHKEVLDDRGLNMDNHKVRVDTKAEEPGMWKITFEDQKDSASSWECFVAKEDGGLIVYQDFDQQYAPSDKVTASHRPEGQVDFSLHGAYSQYNWELFFHVPLLLADRLSKNQRFEEAQEWFHHIFDPTDLSGDPAPQRYWKVAEFYKEAGSIPIVDLFELSSYDGPDEALERKRENLTRQVAHWRRSPSDPHVIARFRISAYQKTVVMKYIDNLIAWADQLFRQDTIESINEATQLYILAAEILGKRPLSIASEADAPSQTCEQLLDESNPESKKYYDAFVKLEQELPAVGGSDTQAEATPDASLKIPYFCIPRNDNLLSYWDTVEDRLFKIRHCQNIEGTERELALFQPPIEPGLLVRAAAAGVDISSALRDINAPLPHYRFNVMLRKAIDFCNDVKALGVTFLTALEKRDAEGLEQLRMGQRTFDLQRSIKKKLIEEAEQKVADLEEAKAQTEERIDNIQLEIDWFKLAKLGKAAAKSIGSAVQSGRGASKAVGGARSKEFRKKAGEKKADWESHTEIAEMKIETGEKSSGVGAMNPGLALANTMYGLAAGTSAIPTVITGGAGISSPVALVVSGGDKLKSSFEAGAKVAELAFQIAEVIEGGIEILAEIGREIEEKKRKKKDAKKDRDRLEKQISAAQIRAEIAELEKKKIEKEIENAEKVDAYMRDKFTNLELYNWRVAQLSTLYFQTYQMAYDLAKRAEKAFGYELGQTETTYIRFGYWDSLKKGLLAGEQLYFDLKRMEKAYLDQNKRGYEITKHVSLATAAPEALIKLKAEGQCGLDLPETAFDLDYPGHFMRRIKSVSLTIDCADEPPPHTNINCKLTLLKNSVRMNNEVENGYERDDGNQDSRFRDEVGAVQSIVTSSGKDDNGLFELDLHDDRYLPFEGAGAISSWRIELPQESNRIDVGALTDLVMHIKYTALEGGAALKEKAAKTIAEKLSESGLVRFINVKDEFQEQWRDFLSTGGLNLDLGEEHFPSMFREKGIALKSISLFLKPKQGSDVTDLNFTLQFRDNDSSPDVEFKIADSPVEGLHLWRIEDLGGEPGVWSIKSDQGQVANAENLLLVIGYSSPNLR